MGLDALVRLKMCVLARAERVSGLELPSLECEQG